MSEIFLDTAYAIALSAPTDAHHERAILLAGRLEVEGTRLVTTQAVLLEIGNALSRLRYRKAAVELLDSLHQDPSVEVVPFTERLYEEAFRLFRERQDKEWSLTDCLSFVIMQERGLASALTTDEHFHQAGFRVLLRE